MYNFSPDFLAKEINGILINASSSNITVNYLTSNSSTVRKGGMFVAISGNKLDGHNFLNDAFQRGSVVSVIEKGSEKLLESRPGIVVSDTRIALSKLSAIFSDFPSERLTVVGITGTNGKTTTNWLIYNLFNSLQSKALRIGTLGAAIQGLLEDPGNLTTPDPITINDYLSRAVKSGCKSAVMEVSSHALHQHRADDIKFDSAIFTNLTRDHLDYHNDFESYYQSKKMLFELLSNSKKKNRVGVVNHNSDFGRRLIEEIKNYNIALYTFGSNGQCTVQIDEFDQNISGSRLVLRYEGKKFVISSKLIGYFNAENLTASFACAVGLGFDPEKVSVSLGSATSVPGRLESVGTPEIGVYIDYAHTPDALDNALKALKPIATNKLWVIFGCGGDRDPGKRAQMGEIADMIADKVVVTSDNPRTENPQSIINDILKSGVIPEIVDVDRRSAIYKTLSSAEKGDVVLIAGKGHEDYQIIGDKKIHFSDQEEVRSFFSRKNTE